MSTVRPCASCNMFEIGSFQCTYSPQVDMPCVRTLPCVQIKRGRQFRGDTKKTISREPLTSVLLNTVGHSLRLYTVVQFLFPSAICWTQFDYTRQMPGFSLTSHLMASRF